MRYLRSITSFSDREGFCLLVWDADRCEHLTMVIECDSDIERASQAISEALLRMYSQDSLTQ